ncbi:MAG: HEAT repeat domain-containing protein [Myxococcales bacterium]|nr:HEAT repeat domain-containing protein [Myxococcales bacterium]
MGQFSFHGRLCRILCVVVLMQGAGHLSGAHADARSSYLVRLLQGSSQFRVRAQAAISLGGGRAAPEVKKALLDALADKHPAVRAAAATSLGRLGVLAALGDLKGLQKDPEPPVRAAASAAIARIERNGSQTDEPVAKRGPTRFYVAVGRPGSRVDGVDGGLLEHVQGFIRNRVSRLDGVEVAPDGEASRQAKHVMKKRGLKGFFLESSITGVQKRPGGGTRVVVSVIVATYPDRNMRAIMHGAATAMGGGKDSYRQAVEGAISGALRQLPQAMAR